MQKALILNPIDNVATAISELNKDTTIELRTINGVKKITIKSYIPFGHKFSINLIKKGGDVIKYGEKIGKAVEDIREGLHVHIHNVNSERGRGDLKLQINR
jgi:altronate dehydratase small subunit